MRFFSHFNQRDLTILIGRYVCKLFLILIGWESVENFWWIGCFSRTLCGRYISAAQWRTTFCTTIKVEIGRIFIWTCYFYHLSLINRLTLIFSLEQEYYLYTYLLWLISFVSSALCIHFFSLFIYLCIYIYICVYKIGRNHGQIIIHVLCCF